MGGVKGKGDNSPVQPISLKAVGHVAASVHQFKVPLAVLLAAAKVCKMLLYRRKTSLLANIAV